MAITVPTAAGQTTKIGNVDYVSVEDNSKFVWIKAGQAAPDVSLLATKTELTAVENKIPSVNGLASTTELAAVEAKIPDVTGFAKLSDIPANTGRTVYSALKPTAGDWTTWYQISFDYTAWKVTARHWIKITANSFMPIAMRVMDMPEPSHDTATEVSPGKFTNVLRDGASIEYFTSATRPNNTTDLIRFPQGLYSTFQWYFVDANKVRVGAYGSNEAVIPGTFTGMSQAFSPPFPAGAAFVRYTLKKPDNSVVIYDCPIV